MELHICEDQIDNSLSLFQTFLQIDLKCVVSNIFIRWFWMNVSMSLSLLIGAPRTEPKPLDLVCPAQAKPSTHFWV